MSAYSLHFAESIWGQDVRDFVSERRLNRTDDKLDQCLMPIFQVRTVVCWTEVSLSFFLPSINH
jgi:hypothetical protein